MAEEAASSSIDKLATLQEDIFDTVDREKSTAELLQEAAVKNVENMFLSGQKSYNAKRMEGDHDLVASIREKLIEAGVDNIDQIYDNNRHIVEAANRQPHAQQYHLNRFFSEQLNCAQAKTGIDTRISRNSLIYEIMPDQWEKIIEKQVIPSLVSTGYYNGEKP